MDEGLIAAPARKVLELSARLHRHQQVGGHARGFCKIQERPVSLDKMVLGEALLKNVRRILAPGRAPGERDRQVPDRHRKLHHALNLNLILQRSFPQRIRLRHLQRHPRYVVFKYYPILIILFLNLFIFVL